MKIFKQRNKVYQEYYECSQAEIELIDELKFQVPLFKETVMRLDSSISKKIRVLNENIKWLHRMQKSERKSDLYILLTNLKNLFFSFF